MKNKFLKIKKFKNYIFCNKKSKKFKKSWKNIFLVKIKKSVENIFIKIIRVYKIYSEK